ncbi:GAF and ANTAR domain-containing protein [Rhodococcoides fascians]|uniref:GAF and ANTAR domain-containing protein n=1 Tax=Rhodococcoides fascians TaxID=1828 RepID=UPI0007AACE1D|nr:GAF and ANTAR domain-containing protein [Rhodococcus fascians]AMY52869.1 hypothetical protein A3L23_01519 [Rhodococcus fascians D188]
MTTISEQTLNASGAIPRVTDFQLSRRLAEVAEKLRRQHSDPDRVLATITEAAVAQVPNAEYASITTVMQGKFVHSAALSGEVAGHCDKIQEQLGEGPCLESAIEQTTIRIDDMDSETRWPQFTDAASALGVKSMICFQLYVEGFNFGALNLHSTRTGAFSAEAESIGSLFAAHAAIAFSSAREEQQIRAALTSRDLIGQAKGMLMERYNLNSQAAFALLAKLSQDTNVKLADLAVQLVDDAAKSTE